jgi:hypothetical protein
LRHDGPHRGDGMPCLVPDVASLTGARGFAMTVVGDAAPEVAQRRLAGSIQSFRSRQREGRIDGP